MASFVSNMIEYSGVDNELLQMDYTPFFKQAVIQREVILSEEKPDIGQILKVMAEIEIKETKIVKTTKGISEEGIVLTGKKLFVEGEIRQKIEYVSKAPLMTLHGEYITTPFVQFIVIPEEIKTGKLIDAAGYIVDMNIKPIDDRSFFNSITILITVEG